MRALLSVYDKEGLVELARGLSDLGWELVASGNTAAALADAGIAHLQVADVTGSPEMLGGRVKTLHPKIHGGILADRDEPSHLADLEAQGIEPIDLVVSNLYPFSSDPSIELIDIGGPSMVRGAAKNHAHVGIVTSPADYPLVLDELRRTGSLSDATRRRLARAAFAHTAAYDAAIVAWLDAGGPGPVDGGDRRRGGARWCAGADHPPHLGAHGAAPLRREPAPARGALPHGGSVELVGRGAAARRQGAVLPQPVRRRRRLALGARAGGRCREAGGGHHQARQSLRGRRGRQPGHRLRAGARVRRAVGLRRGGGHRRRGDRGAGRRHRRRAPGRRHHRLVLRARRTGQADGAAQGDPPAVGARTGEGRAPAAQPGLERAGAGHRRVRRRRGRTGRW